MQIVQTLRNLWDVIAGNEQIVEPILSSTPELSSSSEEPLPNESDTSAGEVPEAEKWQADIRNNILKFAEEIKTVNLINENSEHTIFLRRTESWGELRSKVSKLAEENPDNPYAKKIEETWLQIANNVQVIYLKRFLAYKGKKANKFPLNLDLYNKNKNEYAYQTKQLNEFLKAAHKILELQKNFPFYQNSPCKETLEYLSSSWPALTIFAERSDIPITSQGVFLDKKDDANGSEPLNSGRPIALLMKHDNYSWKVKVMKDPNIPIDEKERFDEITKVMIDCLTKSMTNTTQSITVEY
jgi:hypothetical protein